MKVALLEDNPENSTYIQTLLELEGHQVFPYPRGHLLLTALQVAGDGFPYDALIIDLLLPNTLSGLDVMHRIEQDYSWKLPPFIVVSAASRKELDLVQADFPQTPIIRKPFKRQELLTALQTATGRP